MAEHEETHTRIIGKYENRWLVKCSCGWSNPFPFPRSQVFDIWEGHFRAAERARKQDAPVK